MKEKNYPLIINGKECCYRCGIEKNSQEVREGWGCNHWGTSYPTHLWKLPKPKDDELLTNN